MTEAGTLSGKSMPIMLTTPLQQRVQRGERVVFVKSIPWEMIADTAGERQSQRNHSQSLDTIRSRGGFSACEAIAVMSCQPWRDLGGDEVGHRILYSMVVLFNRGRLAYFDGLKTGWNLGITEDHESFDAAIKMSAAPSVALTGKKGGTNAKRI